MWNMSYLAFYQLLMLSLFTVSQITIIYRLIDVIDDISHFFIASSARMWPYFHPYGNYLMPQCGSKRKGGQVRFTPQQTQNLERRFANHKYLSPEDRRKLAMELSLSDRQVKTWFQNRRFVSKVIANPCCPYFNDFKLHTELNGDEQIMRPEHQMDTRISIQ